jgi:carboxymethylenebutenolidase
MREVDLGAFEFIPSGEGRMQTYFALPTKPNGCGIILGSSVWGLNSDLRAVADGYAALGYAVAAPNLFWRLEAEHAMEYDFSKFDKIVHFADSGSDAEGIIDMRNVNRALEERSGFNRSAAIGWCYGGRIVCLAAMDTDYDLCVGMYPTWLEKHLYIAERMVRPMSLHLPEKERFGTVEDAVERMHAAFNEHPMVDCFLYPDVEHGFDFAPPHPYANHAAARLCDNRVVLSLDRVLLRGEPLK